MEPTKHEEILLDLFKWKMLPVAAIHQMHFRRSSALVAYRNVRKLQKLISFERNQIHIHRQWLNREECYGPTKGRRERFVTFHPESELKEALKKPSRRVPIPR